MEAADFVADSDEEAQEMVEALATAEEEFALRQVLATTKRTDEGAELAAALAASDTAFDASSEAEGGADVYHQEEAPVDQQPPLQTETPSQQEEQEIVSRPGHERALEPKDEAHVTEHREADDRVGDNAEFEDADGVGPTRENTTNSVLEVGTVVEVESRTWPGINKPGGSGRVVCVHTEPGEDGESEQVFYDVRYVLGGFEKRIESEFVESSVTLQAMQATSHRKPVPREYYHDNYINEPYKQKQREAAARRARAALQQHIAPASNAQRKKRKRSHGSGNAGHPARKSGVEIAHKSREHEENSDAASSTSGEEEDKDENHAEVRKINDHTFIFKIGAPTSQEADSGALSGKNTSSVGSSATPAPINSSRSKKRKTSSKRRRLQILDSDEESEEESEAHDQSEAYGKNAGSGKGEEVGPEELIQDRSCGHSSTSEQRQTKRRQHKRSKKRGQRKQRYAGGYLVGADEDPDSTFIQPEGNPTALPEDVARETHLVLAKTKEGLKAQLTDEFDEQKQGIAKFREEKRAVDKLLKSAADMAPEALNGLYHKVDELKNFVEKTLIRGGEDVMNTIIGRLTKKGGTLADTLELAIDDLNEEVHTCSAWIHSAQNAMENTFSRRDVSLPFDEVATDDYSSDRNPYDDPANDQDDYPLPEKTIRSPLANAGNDEADYSFEFDTAPDSRKERCRSHAKQLPLFLSRRPISGEAMKKKRSRKILSSTTLDDYDFTQFSSAEHTPMDPFNTSLPRSNLRLIGKLRQMAPSDPRWNWSKLARQRQQGGRIGVRSNPLESARISRRPQPTTRHKYYDSESVQSRRMQLRDKRYRTQASAPRALSSYPVPASSYQAQLNTGTTAFPSASVGVTPEKSHQSVAVANPTITPSHPSALQDDSINWELVFDMVSDDLSAGISSEDVRPIPREQRQSLSTFGHAVQGPTIPPCLLSDCTLGVEDGAEFGDAVVRRVSRLRQLMNDLRLEEIDFMESLSSGDIGADEGAYLDTTGWRSLLNLEEGYHNAFARFAVQVVEGLEEASPASLPSHLLIILEQMAQLIRQLPDCDSVIRGCQSYYFFFEVASRDAKSTPLLTTILRTYWYSLRLLIAVEATCVRLTVPQERKAARDAFLRILPVSRVTLAAMLFLFDLYLHLPSSHYLDDRSSGSGGSTSPSPALSLWLLVYDSFSTSSSSRHFDREARSSSGKDFWALLQTAYRQRYFDELSRCFLRSESSGGYLRDFAPRSSSSAGSSEDCNEVMGSQLLALESTWDLLAILSKCCAEAESDEGHDATSDAKWTVVKELLQPGKYDFLPFASALPKSGSLPQEYLDRAGTYKQRVLDRVLAFSKQWSPCREIIEVIMEQLWGKEGPSRAEDDILKLPHFLKHFLPYARTSGTTTQAMVGFVDSERDDTLDPTTMLCKIIWIQLLKLEKRVHRSRFRRSVLNAVPSTPEVPQSTEKPVVTSTAVSAASKRSGAMWNWGKSAQVNSKPDKPTQVPVVPSSAPLVGTEKERMNTSVLLTFGLVGICLECNGKDLANSRSEKDIKYLEREVDFYCKEIIRGTAKKHNCEVVVAQALYVLGALLMEKRSHEYPVVFSSLNAKLLSSMKDLQAKPPLPPILRRALTGNSEIDKAAEEDAAQEEKRRRLIQCAAVSPLYLLRDLTGKLCEMSLSSANEAHSSAVMNSLEHVLSSGLEACLHAAIQKVIPVDDLKIAMEILQFVLPKAPENPTQCLAVTSTQNDGHSEFDEFDDAVWANVDLDALAIGTVPSWSVQDCRSQVLQLVVSNLRVVLQQLVLNYPPSEEDPTFEAVYAVDLFGLTLSTCDVQFIWSNLRSNAAKQRNLAARVLGATLKYHPEREWLSKSFLRGIGADQELANTWLMGTLDVSALDPTVLPFQIKDTPFSVEWSSLAMPLSTPTKMKAANETRNSSYWIMLTDGIIYNLLRKDPVRLHAIDPLLLKILQGVATACKLPVEIRAKPEGLHKIATLYELHLDVFQAFCKTAGSMWHELAADPALHRQDMNQLRLKAMNPKTGIFVSFLEAYKVNFRHVFGKLDENNHEWHGFSKLFLRQAGVSVLGGRSYHLMDDSIKNFDYRFTDLTTMFRFMYQCMDSFLFHCGGMAIGEANLFFDTMELLFRQVNAAEYPQATKRMARQRALNQRSGVRNTNQDLRKGFSTTAVGFVNSVQLFFAQQKYPSLLHWFAQTSEIYQTFKTGWSASPLRTLLLNILDPDGPLGIYSYYPDDQVFNEAACEGDVASIRREAFYLSCGLFLCRCSRSFEHSRARHTMPRKAKARLRRMRAFVLGDFMWESFDFAMSENRTCLLETMVPICQFIHATLNHANLNIREPTTGIQCASGDGSTKECDPVEFQLGETQACMEWITDCLVNSARADDAICSTLSCVLLIEFCGIASEAVTLNERRPFLEFIGLARLMISYLSAVYVALSKASSHAMPDLFVSSIESASYSFPDPISQGIKTEEAPGAAPTTRRETYGINLMRARTDLLAAIRRVAQECQKSSDERLRGAVVAR